MHLLMLPFLHLLPKSLNPAQVRCGLTSIIQRQLSQADTFDSAGWLRIGYTGRQIQMSEEYINTGSLYLCMAVFYRWDYLRMMPFGLIHQWNGLLGKHGAVLMLVQITLYDKVFFMKGCILNGEPIDNLVY